jgi:Cu+-exporting ATPase
LENPVPQRPDALDFSSGVSTSEHSHHDHTFAWPATGRSRLGILALAVVTLVANAAGVVTHVFGLDTALLVAVLGAYPLAIRAGRALRARQISYDVTIAVAALIAALAGEFLAAAEVVIIVLVGDALEHWAMHRAERAIAGLMSLQPDRATVVRDGREQVVPATDVRLSDRVVVRGGERVPVDGVIIEGHAGIDQSLVTGESIPVSKASGAQVYCGSILDHGAIEIRPELVGQDTTVARIGRLVADAKRRRPPIVRTADRLSRIFLPVILLSAVAVYWLTGEALRSAAVLLVACSCALVYAAPAAFAAALARLARDGVLVKGGDTLEALSSVTAVAFDKTGTVTLGRPSVTDVVAAQSGGGEEVLQLAASAEQRSEHAFGRAIVADAGRRQVGLQATSAFTVRPGMGVVATVAGREVWVGSVAFLRELAPTLEPEIEQLVAKGARSGETHVLVAVDGHLAGLINLMDTPRPDAAAGVAALKAAGIKDVYLITGDDFAVAEAVAAQVGIDANHVHANMLPEQKLHRLRELSVGGARVLMVGDGVNDAPALAAAHIGVAFGRGAADLSAEAAQVVALEPRLEAIAELLVFARKTVKRVRFNIIAFALGVNSLAILAAGLGYLKPAASAILHQIVSLLVILGSVSLLIEHRIRDPRAWSEWRDLVAGRLGLWRHQFDEVAADWITRHQRALVRGSLAVAALVWLSSGVVALGPGESAAVQRFGRLVDVGLQPGLHVRAPWPIEVVTRFSPSRIRVLELGFRSPVTPTTGPIDYEWNTPHGEGQVQQVPDENLVLTGDENLSELYAVLHYTIADPARYLFAVRDAEALVRMVAEGSLRNIVAGDPLDAMLTTDRQGLEQRWADAVRTRLGQIGAGVDVLGIHLADVHPPVEVVDAFRDVASAEEERVMKVNEADAYSKESIPIARGNAKARLEEASGYRASRIDQSQGDASRFLARISETGTAALTMFRLQIEALETVLAGKRIVITDDHKGGKRTLTFLNGDLLRVLGSTSEVIRIPPDEDEK